MKRILSSLFFVVILGAWSVSVAQQGDIAEKKSSAVIAAHNWLALIDRGNYDESWDEAAAFFKNSLSREQWSAAVSAAREPLGSLLSRELLSSSYHTTLPGAPDGEYVVITFSTSFTNKEQAVETITPMLDQDAQWRVSGYYIK